MEVPDPVFGPHQSRTRRVRFYGDREAIETLPTGFSTVPPAYSSPWLQEKSAKPTSRANDHYTNWVERRVRSSHFSNNFPYDKKLHETV